MFEEASLVEELQSALTLEDSLYKTRSALCSLLGIGDARIALLNGEKAVLKGSEESTIPLSGSFVQKVVDSKEYLLDNSLGKLAEFYELRDFYSEGFKSLLAIPLASNEKVFGVLILLGKTENSFDASLLKKARSAASIVSLFMANAVLHDWLRKKERLAQLVFEESESAVLIFDENGFVTEANSNARRLFGSIVGKNVKNFFQANDFVARVLKKELISTQLPSNGGFKTFQLDASSSSDRKTVAIRFFEPTEKDLKASVYEQVSEKSPDVVFQLSGDGKIIFANDSAVELLGFGKKELETAHISKIVFPTDLNLLNERLFDLNGGTTASHSTDLRLFSKDGKAKLFEVAMRGIINDAGRLSKIIFVARDAGLRSSVQKQVLDSVVAYASDAVYSFDTRGVIHSWSSGAEKIFGHSKDGVVGSSVRLLFPQEKEGELDDIIHELNGKRKVTSLETVRKRKNGELFNALVSIAAVTDEKGNIVDYVEVVKDITAEKKMEEVNRIQRKLEERNRQLMELNEMKSVFISNVSHELRTPLTNIHGYSSLLLEGEVGTLNAQQSEFLQVVVNETNRLTKLINDVLDLSKIDSGRLKLSLKDFDLRDLVEKCSCKSLAEKKGLYVNWNIAPEVPSIIGDPNRIAQVLINLVSNGIKFTESGGVAVNISMKSTKFVRIEVADTGIGIPPADQKNLFKRFYQVMRKDGQKQEGTGLGLAITREIIKLHGGKIGVESNPGAGSKFTFIIRVMPKKPRNRK